MSHLARKAWVGQAVCYAYTESQHGPGPVPLETEGGCEATLTPSLWTPAPVKGAGSQREGKRRNAPSGQQTTKGRFGKRTFVIEGHGVCILETQGGSALCVRGSGRGAGPGPTAQHPAVVLFLASGSSSLGQVAHLQKELILRARLHLLVTQ